MVGVCLTLFVFLSSSLFLLTESTRVEFRNNYYTDLTIHLPHVSEHKRGDVLSNLKELLEASSSILYKATKRRAKFLTVNVLVPESWGEPLTWLPCENSTFYHANGGKVSRTDANVVVTNQNGPKNHYTLNADGCGKRGERINVPLDFLLSDKPLRLKGQRFVQLWSEYRYGVFPENGFPHDPLYPNYYTVPGTEDVLVTSCMNQQITYNFTDHQGNPCEPVKNVTNESEECLVTPNMPTASEWLKSSLMDRNIQTGEFCDSDVSLDKSHNPRSLSKHNALCFEEGTWFVILRNPDFAKGRNAALNRRIDKVEIIYTQESNLRIVIVVDVSSGMSIQNRYNLVKSALKKFILYDVPLGTEIGLVFFADTIKGSKNLTRLVTRESKESFLETGIIHDEPETTSETCTEWALRHAIQMLRSDHKSGAIILVTSDTVGLDSTQGILIRDELDSSKIRLSIIHFTQATHVHKSRPLETFAESTGGIATNVGIAEFDSVATLSRLYSTFTRLISTYSTHNTVLGIQKFTDGNTNFFSFLVDEFVSNAKLLLTGPEFEQPAFDISSTKVISPSGKSIPLQKELMIPALLFQINQPGRYVFETKMKITKDSAEAFGIVIGEHKSVESALTLRAWVSFQREDGNAPLKIFAEVRSGLNPVKNAIVLVDVHNPAGEWMLGFSLEDNGLGDPDITRNDGIYSSYYNNFTAPGFYGVVVTANGVERTAIVNVSSNDDCCGSFVPSDGTTPTGKFMRTTYLTIPILNTSTIDDAPPNRITDLKVDGFNLDKMMYNMTWTSAGFCYTFGIAPVYQLKLFSSRNDAKRNFEHAGVWMRRFQEITSLTFASIYGQRQSYSVRLPNTMDSGRYFFAVRAVSKSRQAGQVSNLVEVSVINKRKKFDLDCRGGKGDGGGTGSRLYPSSIFILFVFPLAFRQWMN